MDVEMQGIMLYSTHTLDLVQVLESASPASCKTAATSIDSTPFTQTIKQEETKNTEKRSNSQQIVLFCLGLRT